MTDKVQKIREEVERIINQRLNLLNGDYFDLREETNGFTNEIIDTIDSLQKEPISEELEKEIDKFFKDWGTDEINGGQYGINLDIRELKDIARHFANWQKEQMLANGKSGTVQKDNQAILDNGTYIDLDPSMQLKPSFEGLKKGDRIKVIIIKED